MRRAAVLAASAVLGVAGTVGIAAAQGRTPTDLSTLRPAAGAGPTGPVVLTVVEHAVSDTTADTGPRGDSVGDVLAFANPVFDARNTARVGRDNGSCVRTKVGAAYECSWTLTLRGGSLAVEGPFYDAGDSVLAITGGTGKWLRARGQMRLHARNAAGSEYDFTYTVVR